MSKQTCSTWIQIGAFAALSFACTGGGGSPGGTPGGGTPGGGITVLPPANAVPPESAGLSAIVAADGQARVEWSSTLSGIELALFQGNSPSNLLSQSPVAENLVGTARLVAGLSNGVASYFALGMRAAGTSSYEQAGVVLRAVPAAPFFVDVSARPLGADGLTPASAFPSIQNGIQAAAAQGGGNVWVRAGSYRESIQLVSGVHLYGGFAAGFDIDSRDSIANESRLLGMAGQVTMSLTGGAEATIIDGFHIRGDDGASTGIEVTDADLELRSVEIVGLRDRGLKLRNSSLTDCVDFQIANCAFIRNGADGISAAGALDIRIYGSKFNANRQEGLDLDDLIALDAETATLRVDGCQFFGNGAEGLDVDLAAPLGLGPQGGRFAVFIRGSSFELNAADGLLVDMDYEFTPGWDGEVVIRDCSARANAGAGIHVDADAPASMLIHKVNCSGNAGDGISITSESDAGFVQISKSICAGNRGAGMRASLGNKAIAASHCVLAGNHMGGLLSEFVDSTANSCIAYLQATPWMRVQEISNLELADPLSPGFQGVPIAYNQAIAQSGGTLTLSNGQVLPPASTAEVDDDAVMLSLVAIQGTELDVNPTPPVTRLPRSVFFFSQGVSVEEDYRLAPGSLAEDAGLSYPGAASVDAGPFTETDESAPGLDNGPRESLLRVVGSQPQISLAVFDNQPILLSFSDAIDAASLSADIIRAVTRSGSVRSITFSLLSANEVLVNPPTAGWGGEAFNLQIHRDLRSLAGVDLAATIVMPFLTL